MADLSQPDAQLGFFSKLVVISSFVLAAAYLVGYWWAGFGINIFPFVTPMDLLKFAACPFLILFIPYILFDLLISEWHLVPFISALSKYKLFATPKYFMLPILILAGACLIILGIKYSYTVLYLGVPAVLLAILGILKKVKGVLHDPKQRKLMLISLLPFFSYDLGYHRALDIYNSKEYTYMPSTAEQPTTYKFLGYVNDHYFFIDLDNNKLLINNKMSSLQLQHFIEADTKPNPQIGYT